MPNVRSMELLVLVHNAWTKVSGGGGKLKNNGDNRGPSSCLCCVRDQSLLRMMMPGGFLFLVMSVTWPCGFIERGPFTRPPIPNRWLLWNSVTARLYIQSSRYISFRDLPDAS